MAFSEEQLSIAQQRKMTSGVSTSRVKSLEVTWKRTLTIWWGFIWRCVTLSLLLGFVAGLFCGLLGIGDNTSMRLLGHLINIIASLIVFRILLHKRFSEFSLQLISLHDPLLNTSSSISQGRRFTLESKKRGIVLAAFATGILLLLFPPFYYNGIRHWRFFLSSGIGVVDISMLLLELVLLSAFVGVASYALHTRRETFQSATPSSSRNDATHYQFN